MVGPYWEKLCPLSRVRPSACGLGPYSRPRAQFFPIRTSRPVNNIYLLLLLLYWFLFLWSFYIYLLLTEFEIRTVSTDRVFSLPFMVQARSARAVNRRGKNSIVCLKGSGTISIHAGRLHISEAGRKQNESI